MTLVENRKEQKNSNYKHAANVTNVALDSMGKSQPKALQVGNDPCLSPFNNNGYKAAQNRQKNQF